jgi:hypothetical protein
MQRAAGFVILSLMKYSGALTTEGSRNHGRRLALICTVGLLVSLACALLIWMTYTSLPPDLRMSPMAKVGPSSS